MLVFLIVVLVVMLVACVYQNQKETVFKLWDAVKEITKYLFSKEYYKAIGVASLELLNELSKPFVFVGGVIVLLALILVAAITGKDLNL